MPRSVTRVRPATRSDLPALTRLAEELTQVDGVRTSDRGAGSRSSTPEHYAEALESPDKRILLAIDERDDAVGMALLTRMAGPLLDRPALHLSHVVVLDHHRGRGAGRSLIAAAAAYADEQGFEHVMVSVPPQSREANRFYARLGFAPLAVRRIAPVAVLRRRLAANEARSAEHVMSRPRGPGRRATLAVRRARVRTPAPEV